jgi:small subunit ribosomal protein S13
MRFLGVAINDKLVVNRALTDVYGIGKTTSLRMCDECGLSRTLKLVDVTEEALGFIRKSVELVNVEVGSELVKKVNAHVEHYKKINCYRGMRHKLGLPVRGQRTHTNAKTVRRLRHK